MTQPYLTEKQLDLLAEALEAAKEAEQKAREASEFAIAMDEKYKKRMEEIRKVAKESVSVTE